MLEEEKEPNYLNAGVGEYAVFNCDLDFPHETPIPYMLQWNRDVSVVKLVPANVDFILRGIPSAESNVAYDSLRLPSRLRYNFVLLYLRVSERHANV